MTKQEVQQRVLKNGKPLDLNLFEWDEKTNTFSTLENGLVIYFKGVSDCTFNTGSDCTFKTGSDCTFNTGSDCTFNTGSDCTFKTGSSCTFDTWSDCTFNTGSDCTFKTGSSCTFDTGHYCTFDTGYYCTFKTGFDCTFNTGYYCTFDTGHYCTFKTGFDCTFKTGSYCTFDTGERCVIVCRDAFQVIQPKEGEIIKLCPYEIAGYISKQECEEHFYMDVDGKRIRYEIIDGILSKVISQRGNVMKVVNHGETNESYIVTDGINYAHGNTIKEAKESLIYKISDRDTSMYKDYTLETKVSIEDGIKMYRKITGACESQTKSFVENMKDKKDEYSISEILKITEGQYNNNLLAKFFTN